MADQAGPPYKEGGGVVPWDPSEVTTTDYYREGHGAWDRGALKMTKLHAVKNGVVRTGYEPAVYGHWKEIDHGHGWRTFVGHLSEGGARHGDYVLQGQTYAYTGNSGSGVARNCMYIMR